MGTALARPVADGHGCSAGGDGTAAGNVAIHADTGTGCHQLVRPVGHSGPELGRSSRPTSAPIQPGVHDRRAGNVLDRCQRYVHHHVRHSPGVEQRNPGSAARIGVTPARCESPHGWPRRMGQNTIAALRTVRGAKARRGQGADRPRGCVGPAATRDAGAPPHEGGAPRMCGTRVRWSRPAAAAVRAGASTQAGRAIGRHGRRGRRVRSGRPGCAGSRCVRAHVPTLAIVNAVFMIW